MVTKCVTPVLWRYPRGRELLKIICIDLGTNGSLHHTVPVGVCGVETSQHGLVVPLAVGAVTALGIEADVHRIAPGVLS